MDRLGVSLTQTGAVYSRREALRRGCTIAAISTPVIGASCEASGENKPVASLTDALSARQFGARFDGRTDDSAALQAGIDEAARTGRALSLPAGTAALSKTLNLLGRNVTMVGRGFTKTSLKAVARLKKLIDAEESTDVMLSPFHLQDLALDGSNLTDTNLAIRFRHHSILAGILSMHADTAIRERDTWLSRRFNCRVQASRIGWHLVGSNHSSIWEGCSFIGSTDVHLLIQGKGSAADGNRSLLFRNCDIEFGRGTGLQMDADCAATLDTCYIGEEIAGGVIRNSGHLLVRGGTLFFGHSPEAKCVTLLGGNVTVENASVLGQRYGNLATLAGVETAATANAGTVAFKAINAQFSLGGDPIAKGDLLARGPQAQVFAPRLGRLWKATSFMADAQDAVLPDDPNGRRVRCRVAHGDKALIGLSSPLDSREWRNGRPLYLVLVYAASAPVQVRLSASPLGGAPTRVIGLPPATPIYSTYMKMDALASSEPVECIELLMPATPGAWLSLREAFLADAAMIELGASVLGNLYKC